MGPVIHTCTVCARRVAALPIEAEHDGAVEIPRWSVMAHRVAPRRGEVCPGSGAVILGAHRAVRPAVQAELFTSRPGAHR